MSSTDEAVGFTGRIQRLLASVDVPVAFSVGGVQGPDRPQPGAVDLQVAHDGGTTDGVYSGVFGRPWLRVGSVVLAERPYQANEVYVCVSHPLLTHRLGLPDIWRGGDPSGGTRADSHLLPARRGFVAERPSAEVLTQDGWLQTWVPEDQVPGTLARLARTRLFTPVGPFHTDGVRLIHSVNGSVWTTSVAEVTAAALQL